MTGYTKLFSSIIASTVWCEDDKTRIVWITMLATKGRDGLVEASVPGLAALARVSVESCRAAVEKLEAPDPDSRTPDHEGRRIKKVEGGWVVLNHAIYRAKMNADERREYLRVKKAESRAKQRESQHGVNNGQSESTPSTHTEAETDAKAEAIPTTLPEAPSAPVVRESKALPTSLEAKAIADLFNRRHTTEWSGKEIKAFKALQRRGVITMEAIELIAPYYAHQRSPDGDGIHRRDLCTFLNNFDGELDRARSFKENPRANAKRSNANSKSNPRVTELNTGIDYTPRPAPAPTTDWAT
jgi:hypothetical protein